MKPGATTLFVFNDDAAARAGVQGARDAITRWREVTAGHQVAP
jgi:hypothetical protein